MVETIPSRFFANADRLGARPQLWFHAGGHWVPLGWRASATWTREFASGLIALGHAQGDRVAILSATRLEWMLADLGTLAAGGVSVGVYPSMTADQTRYVVAHCDAKFLVVEDKKQLAKVDSVRAQMPALETIIVIDPTGCTLGPGRIPLDDLLAKGRAARHDIDARLAQIRLEDAATFVYTSGTTGPPKGAMLTHGNFVASQRMLEELDLTQPDDHSFIFLPLAHVLQRAVCYIGVWNGIGGTIARSLDTISEDLAVARPTTMASVPRIFEKIYARILDQASKGSPRKRQIFDWAVATGKEVSQRRQAREPIPPTLALKLAIARKLVFGKMTARLGGRVRFFITGGAPIAKEILEFFDAAGILILEGWGMTETVAAGTINLPTGYRFGSIGRPVPRVEMKLDSDGEMLIRGPNVFSGYYKDDDATKASFTADGWFRTGDIGKVDADGYWYIVDRKKDLLITAAGKNIAPQNIENTIKSDARISQVVAIGDRKPYLVALVTVTPEVRAGKSEADLVAMVGEVITAKNQELASYERIKKFRILPEDLTQEAGELTPTLKVKRKVVTEKYAALIEAMYAEAKPAQGVQAG